jgi:uncharacterized paraquat-inducible protein A
MTYDDDFDDRDDPQPEDIEDLDRDNDDEDEERCPACGRSVYAGAPRCPYCGEWFTGETTAGRRSQSWFWAVMVAVLIAVILVMWSGLGR